MQDEIKRTNRFTTPCEETPRNNPEGGKRETKKNEEERGEQLTDVNYIPKISFQITCLKCITSFQFIRNNRKLLNCPKYEKVSIEGMLLDNLLNHE